MGYMFAGAGIAIVSFVIGAAVVMSIKNKEEKE
jgi:hypothetical protein